MHAMHAETLVDADLCKLARLNVMQTRNLHLHFFSDLLVLGHNVHMLRLIKSDAEIKLLRESASLASRAITKVQSHFFFF